MKEKELRASKEEIAKFSVQIAEMILKQKLESDKAQQN